MSLWLPGIIPKEGSPVRSQIERLPGPQMGLFTVSSSWLTTNKQGWGSAAIDFPGVVRDAQYNGQSFVQDDWLAVPATSTKRFAIFLLTGVLWLMASTYFGATGKTQIGM